MDQKRMGPVEMSDAEIDVVSGGSFVGIKQSNRGGNLIVSTGKGGGGAAVAGVSNDNDYQYNDNSAAAVNTGSVK